MKHICDSPTAWPAPTTAPLPLQLLCKRLQMRTAVAGTLRPLSLRLHCQCTSDTRSALQYTHPDPVIGDPPRYGAVRVGSASGAAGTRHAAPHGVKCTRHVPMRHTIPKSWDQHPTTNTLSVPQCRQSGQLFKFTRSLLHSSSSCKSSTIFLNVGSRA